MNRSFGLLLVGVIAAGLAIGAGLAAYQAAPGQPTGVQAMAPSTPAPAASNASEQPSGDGSRMPRPGATISGTVTAASAQSVTVKTESGERAVQLSGETAYRRNGSAAIADLKPGETILVTGEAAADGAVSARTIQVGQLMDAQRGPARMGTGAQARSGAGGSPAFGRDRGVVSGTIRDVGSSDLTVEGPNGSVAVTVTPQTRIRRQEAATASDLKPGVAVVITTRGADAPPTALMVQIEEQG